MSYQGAGILFYARDKQTISLLLAQRKHSGVWSIPGGGTHGADSDPWATALRETTEEFGIVPPDHLRRFNLRFPFGLFGFDWTTFVVELPEIPTVELFPDLNAKDFHNEFRGTEWFPIHALPPKTHWLLYPLIWRFRLGGHSRRSLT